MNLKVSITFLVILTIKFSSVSAAKRCYQCSTTVKPHCADLSDTTSLDTCQTTIIGDEINCLSYWYQLNGRNITYRGCRKQGDTCDDVKNAIEMEGKVYLACSLCNTDYCGDVNKSFDLRYSSVLVGASVILLKIFT